MTRHDETCMACVDSKGNLCQCTVRDTCYDDASTNERRKQTITPWPEITTE